MSFENTFNKSINNEEEDDLVALRMAALESMHNNINKSNTTISNNNKVNHISDQKRRTNPNNYCRNGSKRSNLIVLTANESDFSHCKSSNIRNSSNSSAFTSLKDKSSQERLDLSSQQKRVLPGRFSRLERDEDSDDDSEEYSDGSDGHDCDVIAFNTNTNNNNNSSNEELSAFNKESEDQLFTFNATTDVMSDTNPNRTKRVVNEGIDKSIDSNSNDCTNSVNNMICSFKTESNVNCNEKREESLCSTSSATRKSSRNTNNDYPKLISYNRKDMIKLNINKNKISGLDILERRKQKFGHLVNDEVITKLDNNRIEWSESANSHKNNTNHRLSIKQRLSTNNSIISNDNKSWKNCRHRTNNSNNSNNSKQLQISIKGIEKSFSSNTRTNRQTESQESDDNESLSNRKKLRSLVVMK